MEKLSEVVSEILDVNSNIQKNIQNSGYSLNDMFGARQK